MSISGHYGSSKRVWGLSAGDGAPVGLADALGAGADIFADCPAGCKRVWLSIETGALRLSPCSGTTPVASDVTTGVRLEAGFHEFEVEGEVLATWLAVDDGAGCDGTIIYFLG